MAARLPCGCRAGRVELIHERLDFGAALRVQEDTRSRAASVSGRLPWHRTGLEEGFLLTCSPAEGLPCVQGWTGFKFRFQTGDRDNPMPQGWKQIVGSCLRTSIGTLRIAGLEEICRPFRDWSGRYPAMQGRETKASGLGHGSRRPCAYRAGSVWVLGQGPVTSATLRERGSKLFGYELVQGVQVRPAKPGIENRGWRCRNRDRRPPASIAGLEVG